MYDIPELENKWKKWKRKKIQKPIIIASVSVILVSSLSFLTMYYLNSKKSDAKVSTTTNVATHNTKKETNVSDSNAKGNGMIITKTSINKPTQAVQQKEPVKTNSDSTIDITKAEIVKPNVPEEDIRVIGFDKKAQKDMKTKYQDVIDKNSKVAVDTSAEDAAIQEVKDRFKATQDTKDSLYLAKFYYNKGEYKKAESWAISTNNIDGDIEESWLIFAKARAKQGKRTDAIKVLQTYYDETKSVKAKSLLKKLRLGKPFK